MGHESTVISQYQALDDQNKAPSAVRLEHRHFDLYDRVWMMELLESLVVDLEMQSSYNNQYRPHGLIEVTPYDGGREPLVCELVSEALRLCDLMETKPSALVTVFPRVRADGGGGLSLGDRSKYSSIASVIWIFGDWYGGSRKLRLRRMAGREGRSSASCCACCPS